MAKVDMYNMEGAVVGSIELSDAIFGIEPNANVMHLVVLNQLANRRQGTHSTKTRSEVRGGGKKPYRQKGTGRARQGSIRSAQWIKGGIIFGPKPRDYSYTMPKKVKRLALRMALSARNQEGNLIVVDQFQLPEIKTKNFVQVMDKFQFDNCLVVTEGVDDQISLSARNAVGYKVLPVAGLNVYDILKHSKLMLVQSSLQKIEDRVLV